ncbi:MAG: hypothetical protein NT018_02845 [Armatimonadetes bacterium]|nr:hypothetical protein [Armatimonadota bacterium]
MNQTLQENELWTKQDLMEVAKRQKNVLLMLPIGILLYIAVNLCLSLPPPVSLIALPVGFIWAILVAFAFYKMAEALRLSNSVVYFVLAWIPFVALIALLNLNSKAIKKLQDNEIKVGFMGVKTADFEKLL